MSCQADLQSWLESAQNCVSQAIRPCIGWMPCLQRRRQVHPVVASNPFADSQFVQLSSHRRIRVVHIDANKHKSSGWCMNRAGTHVDTIGLKSEGCRYISKRSPSLISNCSEEYWFTRWNRPLRMSDPCNCSFRKSWRNSLGDSKLILNEVQDENKDVSDQMLDTTTLQEKCSDQEDKSASKRCDLLQLETFVEELLQEVWNEVFLCLSQIEHKMKNSPLFEFKEIPLCSSTQHKDLVLNCVRRMKCEPVSNCQFRNDVYNCRTVISCHPTAKDCHIVETVNNEMEVTNEEQAVSTPLKSIGCVNPSFLGSSTNPDLLEYVVASDAPTAGCDASSLSRGMPDFDGDGTKCFDDTDSGFNTVSLESTNHHTNDVDCYTACKSDNERSNTGSSVYVTERTLADSYTANPNEIHLTESQPHISTDSQINDKIFEAKDDSQEYNQTTFTSVDIRLPDTYKTQESDVADEGPKSQKSNIQQRRNKQCYHTRNVRRHKPLLYFLHGVGCSADLWSALLQHFTAAGYEVVAPDMLGHGYSSAPDNASAYTFHRLLKDSIDIFDQFVGEHHKCVIIGHAYGCSLAAAIARYRAHQVSHLILISGGGPAPLAPRTADSRPPSVSPCLLACMKPLLMCGFRRNILYAPCGKHIESCPTMSKGVPQYVLHHVAQGQDWPEGDATFHRRILAPTLLVHGAQDPYVTLVQECEMERTIPRSFLELIPDAGHLSMLETPAQLSHMIHCFVDWWSR